MTELVRLLPMIGTMVVLMGFSAFFSASEAALFYLKDRDLRQMGNGSPMQRRVVELLQKPERVLSGILFWNLLINMATFAISSMVAIRLEAGSGGSSAAIAFGVISLLAVVFFCEMLPKSLAVLTSKGTATMCVPFLSVGLRIVDPILPFLNSTNVVSQRLFAPRFKPEPFLVVDDLERAVKMSDEDAKLMKQERIALENIVSLSEIRVDEWMRPIAEFLTFEPPVTLEELKDKKFSGDYVLICEQGSEDVVQAIWLPAAARLTSESLDEIAEPVVYVPWCTTVSKAMEKMAESNLQVAVVINEFGETIGIVILDDLMDAAFTVSSIKGPTKLEDDPDVDFVRMGTDRWTVSGSASIRRLAREMGTVFPESRNVTVRGLIQEALQRLAKEGDRCEWGEVDFHVTKLPERGKMVVEAYHARKGERE